MLLILHGQLFSILLVITNIIGVLVGGFGTLVSIRVAADFAKFLKVPLSADEIETGLS